VTQTRAGDAAFVETTAAGDLPRFEAAWRDLMDRCAEPNVFADADFLLPALARLAPRRAATILVWSDAGRRRLIGLAAIEPPRSPLGLARIWRSEQAALAALLIDRAAPVEALGAILAWTAARAVGLRLPALESGGPVARALAEVAANGSLALEIHARRQRAALPSGPGEEFEAAIDKKRRKEWARQRRRLAEHGRLESSLLDPVVGVETFLTLEGRGWKGARRTALALNAARAAFARDMLARFAARGALRIDALTLDGEAIAVGLTLRCRERGFYWKTAPPRARAGPEACRFLRRAKSSHDRQALAGAARTRRFRHRGPPRSGRAFRAGASRSKARRIFPGASQARRQPPAAPQSVLTRAAGANAGFWPGTLIRARDFPGLDGGVPVYTPLCPLERLAG